MVWFICSRQLPIKSSLQLGLTLRYSVHGPLPTSTIGVWLSWVSGLKQLTLATSYFRVYSFLTAPASYHRFSGFRQQTFPHFLPNSSLSQNCRSSSQSPHLVFLSLLPVPTAHRWNGIPWLTVSFPIFTSWQWEKCITRNSSTPFPYVRASTLNE